MCIKCRIREALKEPEDGSIVRDHAIAGLGMVLAEMLMTCEAREVAGALQSIVHWRNVAIEEENAKDHQPKAN